MKGQVLLAPLTWLLPWAFPTCLGGHPSSPEAQAEPHQTLWGSGFYHQFLAHFDQWEKGHRRPKKVACKFLALPFFPMCSCPLPSWIALRLSSSAVPEETFHPPWPAKQLCSPLEPWPPWLHALRIPAAHLPCHPSPSCSGFPAMPPSNKEYLWHTLFKNRLLFIIIQYKTFWKHKFSLFCLNIY